jgi:hypothetical protein
MTGFPGGPAISTTGGERHAGPIRIEERPDKKLKMSIAWMAAIRQGFRSTGQPNRLLATLLACVFILACHCQLWCGLEGLWAEHVTHSCCNYGSAQPQSHHSDPGCCRSHYPPLVIRSRLVSIPQLSVRALATLRLIAPPPVGAGWILVDRAFRITSNHISDASLRI